MKKLTVLAAPAADIRRLERLLLKCKDAYYNSDKGYVAKRDEFPAEALSLIGKKQAVVVTDALYDALEDLLREWSPNSEVIKMVGAPVATKAVKTKVTLPYPMSSLDKIKPHSGSVDKWLTAQKGPYLVSDKADAVSIEIVYAKGKPTRAYTRGDGTTGQDISFLVPHLRIPDYKGNLAVRGEIIMPMSVFQSKWVNHFANPRNMAAGLTNRRDVHQAVKDLRVLVYRVLDPVGVPSKQLAKLKTLGFDVIPHKRYETLTEDQLITILDQRKTKSKYEIDGLVVVQDKVCRDSATNPTWGVAFKSETHFDSTNAKVLRVDWNISRHGYLIPRIVIDPVSLRGVTVSYATGKNAAFIRDNKIGPGAVVKLRRSGDVIPDIKDGDVVKPGKVVWPSKKDYDWEWTESGENIYVVNHEDLDDDTLKAKQIEFFFTRIGVERFKAATIQRFLDGGYGSVESILKMSERKFVAVGANKTMVEVWSQIQNAITDIDLPVLMDASQQFGRSMGSTRCAAVVKAIPNIVDQASTNIDTLTELIDAIPGFDQKTGRQFAVGLKKFVRWLKLVPMITYKLPAKKKVVSRKLAGVSVIFTGFRDAELERAIESNGGVIATTVRKATILLAKDVGASSSKLQQARELGVKVMTADMFRRKYGLK